MSLAVTPLTLPWWPALENLFGRSGASNGCWCMYWRIGPRYHDRPRAENKNDLRQLAGSEQPPGLLAVEGELAVGWCELAPRADLAWLGHSRFLGPVDDLPVWSLPCFYVRRTHRGTGVVDALIEAAVPIAAAAGAPALEAYPVDTSVPGHTTNLFPGAAARRRGPKVVKPQFHHAMVVAAADAAGPLPRVLRYLGSPSTTGDDDAVPRRRNRLAAASALPLGGACRAG
jgi:GNAT superfamily N-acetyltransferase